MRILIVAILFFVNFLAFSQAKVWVKFGDEALEEGDNYAASKFYLKAFAEDSTYEALLYKLGLSFKGYHNDKKALLYFKRIEASPELKLMHPTYQFHIAEIYKNIGDYDKSVSFFKKYTRTSGVNTRSFEYLKAKNELKNNDKVQLLLKDTVDVEIQNLGLGINTGAAEYYPVWLSDSTILYSALRTNNISNEGVVEDENYLIRIYTGILKDSIWQSDEVIDLKKGTINKSYTDGCIDNKEIGAFYFSKENSEGNYQIVKTKFTAIKGKSQSGTQLKMDSIVSVVFSFDDYLYNYRNPFVINVSNKKYMLFSSDRKGGRGQMDLWYSEFKRGVWSTPKNLGNKVNSPGNEVGPNYNLKTFKFHFASDWHYNLGGFDLFEAIGVWK
jgi:OOP family OmpA-OmpF porin